tara:strand:- start:308 stop:1150 length:843 start_codon:yes stop_codon:yes gene_type:complete
MTAIGRPYALTALVAACRLPLAVMATLAVLAAAAARFGRRRPSNGLQTPFQASVPAACTSLDQLPEAAGGARSELSTPGGGSDNDVALDPLGLRDLDPSSQLLQVPCCVLSLYPQGELALPRLGVRALPSPVEVSQLEQIFAEVRRTVGQVAARFVGRPWAACSDISLKPPPPLSACPVYLLLPAQVRGVMDREEHFTVFWDLRQLRPPSPASLKFGVGWMGRPENAADFDESINAIVIMVASPIVRLVAEWSIKACNPPNPVHVVSDEAEAIEAARRYT